MTFDRRATEFLFLMADLQNCREALRNFFGPLPSVQLISLFKALFSCIAALSFHMNKTCWNLMPSALFDLRHRKGRIRMEPSEVWWLQTQLELLPLCYLFVAGWILHWPEFEVTSSTSQETPKNDRRLTNKRNSIPFSISLLFSLWLKSSLIYLHFLFNSFSQSDRILPICSFIFCNLSTLSYSAVRSRSCGWRRRK